MSKNTPMSAEFEEESIAASERKQTGGPDNYTFDGDDGVDTELLARDVANLTWDLKALNTCVIDLRGRVSYTDFVIVCTATAERHVQAMPATSCRALGRRVFTRWA